MATIKETIDLVPDDELKGWLLHTFRYFLDEDPEEMYNKLGLNIQTLYVSPAFSQGIAFYTSSPLQDSYPVYLTSEGGHKNSNRALACLYGLMSYYRRRPFWYEIKNIR